MSATSLNDTIARRKLERPDSERSSVVNVSATWRQSVLVLHQSVQATCPTLPTTRGNRGIPLIRRKRRVTGNAPQKRIRVRAR
jgi:hypothetical protein